MIYGTPEFNALIMDMIQRKKRHDMYQTCCDCADAMAIHIYGDKPIKLLERTRPREPEEVMRYRIENYEPTTKATATKGISILNKIFNPWLYEIKWKEQTTNGKKLQDYTLEYYPDFNSIVKFMSEAGMKRMIADPNGVIAIRPDELPETEMQMVEPEIYLYGSKSIWWKDEDSYIIFLKSDKPSGANGAKKGEVFYFTYYDADFVIDFTAQAVTQKNLETIVLSSYSHSFSEIPVWALQGEAQSTDSGNNYFVSFFEAALPFWNMAITHESDLTASYINHLFPQKIEITSECDYVFEDQRCNNGKIPNAEGKPKTCPSCQGTGLKRVTGPFGVYQVSSDKLQGSDLKGMVPVQYATVPVEPTKMLEVRVDRLHERGLEALNMDIVNDIGENQSGVAKVIDRGELYDFLYKVASVVFDTHLTNIYYFMNKYMFGVVDSNPGRDIEKNLPEISKPVKFDISSTPELTAEYKMAKDAEVNPEYLRQKQIALISKEFANNPDLKRKLILIVELDPLPGLTVEEADQLFTTGVISKEDATLHFQMSKFINQALIEDPNFYNLDQKAKLDVLNKYASDFVIANKPKVDTAALYANNPPVNANA